MSDKMKNPDNLCINTIRFLAVDGVQKANSGHPGMPMGCAPIAYMLYTKLMKHNPSNPKWFNRDRFVLSAGHGSMLLYSVLHLTGYNISMDDLKQFRQWGSLTPGHPESHLTPGVEATTGPLGQGIANSVGMAIAQEYLASKFNKDDIKLLDHYIYSIAGDGCLMEGISHEAASLAGHLKLGRIILFYDNNNITIDGNTSLAYSDDVPKRFEAYNWQVLFVSDVNDISQIEKAVAEAKRVTDKPAIIITNTHIGYGSPNRQDKSGAHGSPLGEDEVKLTKKNLGWPEDEKFYIPQEAADYFSRVKAKGEELEKEWKAIADKYAEEYPAEARMFLSVMNGEYGGEWKNNLPKFGADIKKMATRTASGNVINAIAPFLPGLIGGSADLAPSNNTYMKDYSAFTASDRGGRNFHFGVREHGMAGVLNGMAYYGGLIPFGGTFLVFSDYLRPSLRIGCLAALRPIYIFTHDSIGLGEDGPTHQAVEHLASLRAIPGLLVLRPADANETSVAWKAAIEHKGSPALLILTRQDLPVIDQEKYNSAEGLLKGAYILQDTDGKPDVILMASGSEVPLILKAADELAAQGVKARVVSFPSWELFEKQTQEYRNSVFPPEVKARVAVEAAVKTGWHKYAGNKGEIIGMDSYGASAPAGVLMEKYGFTVANVVDKAKLSMSKKSCC
ncbi:MAG: transketolase [Ignavibacteria bacterium]